MHRLWNRAKPPPPPQVVRDDDHVYPTYGGEEPTLGVRHARSRREESAPWDDRPRPRFSFLRRHGEGEASDGGPSRALLHGVLATQKRAMRDTDAVAQDVMAFCFAQPSYMDREYAYELLEMVDASDAHAKTAMAVLRRILKCGVWMAQCRAMRAWGMWTMQSQGAWAAHAMQAKFFAAVEEVWDDAVPPLRRDLHRVLAAVVYEAPPDKSQRLAKLWARIRPAGRAEAGEPLDEPLFHDEPMLPRSLQAAPGQQHRGMPAAAQRDDEHAPIPPEDRQLECVAAHTCAVVLTDALRTDDRDDALIEALYEDAASLQAQLQSYARDDASQDAVLRAVTHLNEALALHNDYKASQHDTRPGTPESELSDDGPAQPSEKALGKRRAMDEGKPPLPPIPRSIVR